MRSTGNTDCKRVRTVSKYVPLRSDHITIKRKIFARKKIKRRRWLESSKLSNILKPLSSSSNSCPILTSC
jgi:hypothetical protein